jgi:hypothetical protein
MVIVYEFLTLPVSYLQMFSLLSAKNDAIEII